MPRTPRRPAAHPAHDRLADGENAAIPKDRPDDQAASKATELYEILETLQWHERLYLSGIDEFLPGVKHSIFDEKKKKVFLLAMVL